MSSAAHIHSARTTRKNRRFSSLARLGKRSETHLDDEVDESAPIVLPAAVRSVLEAIEAMAHGHEQLSSRMRQRWQEEFPLVRSLTATWSDQVSS